MRPEQVIDSQVDLYKRIIETPVFRESLVKTLQAQSGQDATTRAVVEAMSEHIKAAYAYRVTEEMSDLVRRSADLLNEEDVIDIPLAPTGCGFVRFEKSLTLVDSRQKPMNVDWLSWGPASVRRPNGRMGSGVFISLWNDLRKPDMIAQLVMSDEKSRVVRQVAGDWGFIGGALMLHGDNLGPARIALDSEDVTEIAEIYRETHPALAGELGPYTNVKRWVHALWLMLNQTITEVEEEHVRSTAAKRARFVGVPGRVTVVRLRRVERPYQSDEHGPVAWSHRWYVRGHWRWQAYGTNRSERRRIWVNPFIKGPADKPLIVTDKVYDLSR